MQPTKKRMQGVIIVYFGFCFTQGFNRIFNETHAFGRGVYFARDARYSLGYATRCDEGYHWMLYCRVICGEWIPGKRDYKEPPSKPNMKPPQNYESMFSTIEHGQTIPEVVVTATDGQAYPLFLCLVKRN